MAEVKARTQPNVVVAFPAFEEFWRNVESEPIPRQVERWEREYMAPWRELR